MRLVASDLDGTLLRPDGTVSERTRTALVAAEHAGLVVVFVTGRPIRWTDVVFEHVGRHGLAICSNGAVVYDVPAEEVRTLRALEPDAALEVARRIRAAVPGILLAVEQVAGISLEEAFVDQHRVPPGARRGPLEEIVDGPVVKLLARHGVVGAQEFWQRAEAVVGDLAEITWSSTTALLEISAAGVTKATTLALLCADLGIDAAQVVAIGDMPNDLAMLEWVGTSYAMGNAHPTVRAVADHVAATNDEDGVAQVLEELVGRA